MYIRLMDQEEQTELTTLHHTQLPLTICLTGSYHGGCSYTTASELPYRCICTRIPFPPNITNNLTDYSNWTHFPQQYVLLVSAESDTLQCISIRPRPTLEGRTQESEPTPGKLLNDIDINNSPFNVGDSRYDSIYPLIHPTLYLHLNLCLCAW